MAYKEGKVDKLPSPHFGEGIGMKKALSISESSLDSKMSRISFTVLSAFNGGEYQYLRQKPK